MLNGRMNEWIFVVKYGHLNIESHFFKPLNDWKYKLANNLA